MTSSAPTASAAARTERPAPPSRRRLVLALLVGGGVLAGLCAPFALAVALLSRGGVGRPARSAAEQGLFGRVAMVAVERALFERSADGGFVELPPERVRTTSFDASGEVLADYVMGDFADRVRVVPLHDAEGREAGEVERHEGPLGTLERLVFRGASGWQLGVLEFGTEGETTSGVSAVGTGFSFHGKSKMIWRPGLSRTLRGSANNGPEGFRYGVVLIYDHRDWLVEQTIETRPPGRSHDYRYDYETDEVGNWTRRLTRDLAVEDAPDGGAPVEALYRRIRYRASAPR